MVTIFYDSYCILNKVYREGAFLKQAINDVPIEELNRPKTTKIVYGVLDRDIELNYYIDCLCQKRPKPVIVILLKIAMYAIYHLEKKPYAVIDNIVELTKKVGKGANSGFVNAILRKFSQNIGALSENASKNLSLKYSYPQFALDILTKDYGVETAERIIAFNKEKTFVRFKKEVNGEEYLTNNGYVYEKTPFDNLFAVEKIKINDDFNKGIFTFQSIGSVAICDVITECGNLLDACAAPGGKSVYLAERFKTVTSFELHPHRVELINAYKARMGADNVTALQKDSQIFDSEYKERFDVVLCDVPCSGYGTLSPNPDIKLKNKDYIDRLLPVQYGILNNCANYVKIGGAIYYSTCSLFKAENDKIVEKFLNTNANFEVQTISSPLNCLKTEYGLQFLPHLSCGVGFYVCKLVRKK